MPSRPEGNRAAKGYIASWAAGCDTAQNGFTPTNSNVLGPSGEALTETDGNGNWIRSNVYAAETLVAVAFEPRLGPETRSSR